MNSNSGKQKSGMRPEPSGKNSAGTDCPGLTKPVQSPYKLVRDAFRSLGQGRFDDARRQLSAAAQTGSLSYLPGSVEEREFEVEMQMIRVIMLILTERFRELPPDE